jgi:hypothetical protein
MCSTARNGYRVALHYQAGRRRRRMAHDEQQARDILSRRDATTSMPAGTVVAPMALLWHANVGV